METTKEIISMIRAEIAAGGYCELMAQVCDVAENPNHPQHKVAVEAVRAEYELWMGR